MTNKPVGVELAKQWRGQAAAQQEQGLFGHACGAGFVMLEPPDDALRDDAGDEAGQQGNVISVKQALRAVRFERAHQRLGQHILHAKGAHMGKETAAGQRNLEQVALLVSVPEDGLHNNGQERLALPPLPGSLHGSRHLLAQLLETLFQQGREGFILVAKVQVEGANADIGQFRDLGNAGLVVAASREHLARRR